MPILIRTGIVPEALKDSLRKARRKQVVDKKVFDDMVFRNKLKSFTVAGDLHNSQIQKIMKAANTAITRGVPFRDFKRSLDLDTYKRITSPEVVFRNTAQNAYQLGRFNQQEKLKNIRPFGEYVTFGDDRVRPNHAILNARVAALDDAFWAVNYPPNGHQCRCVRRTFSKRQIDNKGLKVQTFDQINKDAAREQAARGIAPTKQVAPLADPGWQESFTVGDTGAEQFIRNFKNFEPAALKSIVSPKVKGVGFPVRRKTQFQQIKNAELKIWTNKNNFEQFRAVDDAGKIILDKAGTPGKAQVSFTLPEMILMRGAKNTVLTHNHPRGWKFKKGHLRHQGAGFSPGDVRMFIDTKSIEIRAITPVNLHSLKTTPKTDFTKLDDSGFTRYNSIEKEVTKGFNEKIAAGKLSPDQANVDHWPTISRQFAKEFNLSYRVRKHGLTTD